MRQRQRCSQGSPDTAASRAAMLLPAIGFRRLLQLFIGSFVESIPSLGPFPADGVQTALIQGEISCEGTLSTAVPLTASVGSIAAFTTVALRLREGARRAGRAAVLRDRVACMSVTVCGADIRIGQQCAPATL